MNELTGDLVVTTTTSAAVLEAVVAASVPTGKAVSAHQTSNYISLQPFGGSKLPENENFKALAVIHSQPAEAVHHHHIPSGLCEGVAAIQFACTDGDEFLQVAGCGAFTVPRTNMENRWCSNPNFLGYTSGLHLDVQTITENSSTQLRGLVTKPSAAKMNPESFTTIWKRHIMDDAAVDGVRWLLLGGPECSLASICTAAPGDGLHAVSVCFIPNGEDALINRKIEVVASSTEHLHWMLKSSAPTQLLAVGKHGGNPVTESSFFADSLAWAHTARDLSGIPAKISAIALSHSSHVEKVPVQHMDLRHALAKATVLGVAKTRFMEDRPSHGTAVDLDISSQLPSPQKLHFVLSFSKESMAIVRNNDLFVERLVTGEAVPRPRRRHGMALRGDLCCVVTGGTKGLGLQYAKYLARSGCKRLVLTSRSGELSSNSAAELAVLGADVSVKVCDASDTASCAEFVDWLRECMPAVQVFVHAAGVLGFDLIPDMTEAAFEAVVRPKAIGVVALAISGIPTEASLFFSSTASVWSQSGAAHYSAGNACLDAAAVWLQSRGLPGTAINFGPFGDDGMAASLG